MAPQKSSLVGVCEEGFDTPARTAHQLVGQIAELLDALMPEMSSNGIQRESLLPCKGSVGMPE